MSSDVAETRPVGPPEWRVALAGVLVVAVSYGFARYGYGLFLPQLRDAYDLSVSTVGLIASATYAGYLAALSAVGFLATRVGPRPLVVCAGLSASAGMALVAAAPTVHVLVVGLVLAGTSSGWAWAPYSDVVDRQVRPSRRQRVMALVPAGTAFGVVVAGPLALLAPEAAWRYVWACFSLVALVATVENARVLLPGLASATHRPEHVGPAYLAVPGAIRLHLTALSYGLVGAVYWTYAVDLIDRHQATGSATGPVFWTLIGLSGTAGVGTGAVLARLGLRRGHALIFAALGLAVALLGLAPGTPTAVAASAVAYGPSFMAGSGLLAVWSYRLYRERPAAGFSVTVFFLGIGTIVGPTAFGLVADAYGLRAAFLACAALAIGTVAALPQARCRSKNATVRRIDSGQSV